eukprot:CAMPEP_0119045156 /NCGR_PEP_ID=MMETSP1177-20130426/37480_1 /TAXON_ID=2985 /ORGANISM="Ochromonas sp, Strain CCMP1899" /LENGTH=75 /DNA_ID=CAMNT_0007016425 /DNA_START=3943 /DNA_END=4171 /DNA_ORIENTATION=-
MTPEEALARSMALLETQSIEHQQPLYPPHYSAPEPAVDLVPGPHTSGHGPLGPYPADPYPGGHGPLDPYPAGHGP